MEEYGFDTKFIVSPLDEDLVCIICNSTFVIRCVQVSNGMLKM